MNHESLQYLRHELRTYLNHLLGYSEILLEDLKESPHPILAPDIEAIYLESRNIHRAFLNSFYRDGTPMEEFDPGQFRRNLFGPLYILLGLSQRLKQQCEDEHADYLLDDVHKISDSGRKILDLVDQELKLKELNSSALESDDEYRFAIGRLSQVEPERLKEPSLGRILVVDDNEMNRDILVRHLERQGHEVAATATGADALKVLQESEFDLVLLDILMPGMNGYQVLERLKADPRLREIPVIMISALDETESVVHCIAMGAEDYLPKSFDPILLKARISACLSKKHYRDQEQRYLNALLESQRALERELAEAADYVKDLLPKPAQNEVYRTAWVFQPSAKLGGDCFDYHWVDDGKLAIYLLDVSGHGIGAALLSVSVMNVLRSQGLPHTDFSNPAAVLGSLNVHFQMESQNNLYFTIWYGVLSEKTGELSYACAGAPPALLLPPSSLEPTEELGTPDLIVGVDPDYTYENRRTLVRPGSRLYLFSDGAYEVRRPNGKLLSFREFSELLTLRARSGGTVVEDVFSQIQGLASNEHFDDDFSLLELVWQEGR